MAERVGRHRSAAEVDATERLRRIPAAAWFTLAVVAVLVAGVVFALVAGRTPKAITTQLVALPQGSTATRFLVTYEIDKAPLAEAQCTLTAEAADFSTVGTLLDTIGPRTDSRRDNIRTVSIPTTRLATAAQIGACRITRSH